MHEVCSENKKRVQTRSHLNLRKGVIMGKVVLVFWDDDEAEDILGEYDPQLIAPGVFAIGTNKANAFKSSWQDGHAGTAVPDNLSVIEVSGVTARRIAMSGGTEVLSKEFPNAGEYRFTGSP